MCCTASFASFAHLPRLTQPLSLSLSLSFHRPAVNKRVWEENTNVKRNVKYVKICDPCALVNFHPCNVDCVTSTLHVWIKKERWNTMVGAATRYLNELLHNENPTAFRKLFNSRSAILKEVTTFTDNRLYRLVNKMKEKKFSFTDPHAEKVIEALAGFYGLPPGVVCKAVKNKSPCRSRPGPQEHLQ